MATDHDPGLHGRLLELVPAIRDAVAKPTSAVHTDLHSGNVLVDREGIATLIDFGDTTVAPRAWDVGSFLFHNGPDLVGAFVDSLCLDGDEDEMLLDAWSWSILVGLHHATRAATPDDQLRDPARLTRARARLATAVAHLT